MRCYGGGMKRVCGVLAAVGILGMVGCHSAYVDTVVSNRTGEAVSLVEVDYPAASFGTQTLVPGQEFKYRFKVSGSGAMKVSWTDARHQEHEVKGPELHEGDEGGLGIVVEPGGVVDWEQTLKPKAK